MKRRVLFLALAAGFIVLGFGALDARAGLVPLPTTLDVLTANSAPAPGGNYSIVNNPAANESIQFSQFGFIQVTGGAPNAAGVTVSGFTLAPPPGETGLQFAGAFNAAAGMTNDWVLTYRVDELTPHSQIYDAYASITGGNNGGTGTVSVSETFTTLNGTPLGSLEASLTNPTVTGNLLFPVTSFLVTKDIDVVGGSNGATLSVIDQAYSSQGVPEPASWALLGIGMTGFLAFRRFFKKTPVA
jgi:hypothetical protein